MAITKSNIRRGTYYDSIVLMQLQAALEKLAGILNVGVMMGTPANKEILRQNNLLTDAANAAEPADLVITIQGDNAENVDAAFSQIDDLLTRRQNAGGGSYRPRSLDAACKMMPEAGWALISIPGRYAAEVAQDALDRGKNIFLYSDNVSLEDELALKQAAAQKGLLVMGPDCGTAIVNGAGLGFANRIRRGNIGLVGASGTGLQYISARIHQLGGGITHALGTGGRDLSTDIGAITARQCLHLLQGDPQTDVIVLVSKPPAPKVATRLLTLARSGKKPVIVYFQGSAAGNPGGGGLLQFAASLDAAAEMAVTAAGMPSVKQIPDNHSADNKTARGFLRGLFSGGTLAQEMLLQLQTLVPDVYSNLAKEGPFRLTNPLQSQGHTIVDLGGDEFTVGRLHPMLDNTLRIQRLQQEVRDPEVSIIILDVVLGDGAHANPAGELAPAITNAKKAARKDKRDLEIVVLLVGTGDDPQDMKAQAAALQQAGAKIETSLDALMTGLAGKLIVKSIAGEDTAPVDPAVLQQPLRAINIGLEYFADSLTSQEVPVLQMDWRPPAGGDEKLAALLKKLKVKSE